MSKFINLKNIKIRISGPGQRWNFKSSEGYLDKYRITMVTPVEQAVRGFKLFNHDVQYEDETLLIEQCYLKLEEEKGGNFYYLYVSKGSKVVVIQSENTVKVLQEAENDLAIMEQQIEQDPYPIGSNYDNVTPVVGKLTAIPAEIKILKIPNTAVPTKIIVSYSEKVSKDYNSKSLSLGVEIELEENPMAQISSWTSILRKKVREELKR